MAHIKPKISFIIRPFTKSLPTHDINDHNLSYFSLSHTIICLLKYDTQERDLESEVV